MKNKYIRPIISVEEIESELLTASRGWAIDGGDVIPIEEDDGEGFLDLD